MTDSDVEIAPLHWLRVLFDDLPDLLEVLTLPDAVSQEMADALRTAEGLFATPLNVWATGRTGQTFSPVTWCPV